MRLHLVREELDRTVLVNPCFHVAAQFRADVPGRDESEMPGTFNKIRVERCLQTPTLFKY